MCVCGGGVGGCAFVLVRVLAPLCACVDGCEYVCACVWVRVWCM